MRISDWSSDVCSSDLWKDLARRVDVVLRDRRDADLDAAVALIIGLAALGRTFELRFAITERRHASALDAAAGEIIGDRCGAAPGQALIIAGAAGRIRVALGLDLGARIFDRQRVGWGKR